MLRKYLIELKLFCSLKIFPKVGQNSPKFYMFVEIPVYSRFFTFVVTLFPIFSNRFQIPYFFQFDFNSSLIIVNVGLQVNGITAPVWVRRCPLR